MNPSFYVRPEAPGDREAVFAVQRDAFEQPDEAELVEALRGSVHPAVSLVAERDGVVVGHVFVSPVRIEGEALSCDCGGLAPLGVVRVHHGRGIGSALMRAAESASRSAGWGAVFLLGAPAYYERFGFQLAAPLGFHHQSAVFDSAFQVLELEPGSLDGASGWVHYAEPFSRL